MKKKTARWICVIFFLFLCIQFIMTTIGLEPYPALFYPKFKYLADNQKGIYLSEVRTHVIFSGNDKLSLNYRDILAEAPISHRNHMLSNGIKPVDLSIEAGKPFHTFRVGNKIYEFRRTIIPPNEEDEEEFLAFLVRRIYELTGKNNPVEVSFSWHPGSFVYGEGLQDYSSKPSMVRVVQLGKKVSDG